jgi:hypothetical protein
MEESHTRLLANRLRVASITASAEVPPTQYAQLRNPPAGAVEQPEQEGIALRGLSRQHPGGLVV